jgi:hypothetical protein
MILRGGLSPSTVAPKSRNGSAILRIGRRDSDASPTIVAIMGRLAMKPDSNRMVVPLLPQSKTASGWFHSGAGRSSTLLGPTQVYCKPIWVKQLKVAAQSSDVSGFLMWDDVLAAAPSM